ncbi:MULTISPECIES: ATP-binding protein [unclassified Acinetobacter]|uniref:ATP-binding protein n=1 Tax=unclassified Acinetobacter TaxID=196816 RepID=UPI0015D42504|nr:MULTISPECIES: ATP-binding protein [unclassified Acinetobacter]
MQKSHSLKWRLVSSLLAVMIGLWSVVFVWLYIDLQKRLQDTLDQRLHASAQMVARLIQQLPLQSLDESALVQQLHSTDQEPLIACEVSLFSSDISVGQHVIAKTRGAPKDLSQQAVGFSTWQQGETQWRSYVLRRGEIQVVAAERMFLRESLLKQILQSVLIPLILSLLLCIGLIVLIIRREFKALDLVVSDLSQSNLSLNEASQYLTSLDANTMPSEVYPFVQNSNRLVHKLHQSLENEKVFSAYAAHELRSPLTAIKTNVQLAQLMAKTDGNMKLQYSLDQANQSVRRYADLLEQLLMLSNTDQSIEQIKASIQVQPIIAKVLDDLALIYPEATAKIQVDWHSLGDLILPEFVLYSVLKNLLENALLHANADVIEVSMQKNTLHIQDNGRHLNAEDIRYLGQRFWRKSSQQKGHGLGLSLVKIMLQQYVYTIQFEPNFPKGLKITLLSQKS